MNEKYDALLLVSFGGPEGMDDVIPFLENVLRGRNVPPERMEAVAHHYKMFAGISPINEQNRQLILALKSELKNHEIEMPIYWGNRNWHPLLTDTLKQMQNDGIQKALAFVTSAYSSYSSCRQYRENIAAAQNNLPGANVQIDKLRAFYNHPGFVQANVESLNFALQQLGAKHDDVHVAFTAHSIPNSMSDNCDYVAQLQETARLITQGANTLGASPSSPTSIHWQVCYQSRSGPATQPWLEPDILDYIHTLKAGSKLVIAPIGFVSDHMEVIYDLDTEAKGLCEELGVEMVRAATAGTHPAFVSMIRQLIEERTQGQPRLALGIDGARPDQCLETCCPAATRPRAETAPTNKSISANS